MERPCFPVAGGLARKRIQELGCALRKGLSPVKLDEGRQRHPWGVGGGSEAPCGHLFAWCWEKVRRKKKERERETKLTLSFSYTRCNFQGQDRRSETLCCCPALPPPSLRSTRRSPEEDSTGVNALTPLALGGDGDSADLIQLRL